MDGGFQKSHLKVVHNFVPLPSPFTSTHAWSISNNNFPYLLDKFLANDKNPSPLTYVLVFGL